MNKVCEGVLDNGIGEEKVEGMICEVTGCWGWKEEIEE